MGTDWFVKAKCPRPNKMIPNHKEHVEVDIPRKELAKAKRRMKSRPNIFEGYETMR